MARQRFNERQIGPDIDLDREAVYLDDGSRLTEARASRLAETALTQAHARRAGRPSLTGKPAKTPNLTLRVTPDTRETLERIAKAQHRRISEIGRDALEQYIDRYHQES